MRDSGRLPPDFQAITPEKKTHTRISSLYLNSSGTRDRDAMLDAFNVAWRSYRMTGFYLILATDIDALDLIKSVDGSQGAGMPPIS